MIFLISSIPFIAYSQTQPTKYNLQADQVVTIDNHTFIATGNVILQADDITITGDNVSYNKDTEAVSADGNVTLKSPTQSISASKIDYNLTDSTGTIHDVQGFLSPINYLCAKKLERTSETTFKIYEARISTCLGNTPDWSVFMYSGTLEMEGYINANHATTDVLNTPILYLPKLVYPVSTKRQSGFLIPGIGTMSDRGGFLSLKYFFAPTIDFDATVGLNFFTKSGVQQLIETRYASSPEDNFYASFERIDEIDADVENSLRWRAVIKNNFYITKYVELIANANEVSDYLYSRDFLKLGISSFNAENKENTYFRYGGVNFFSPFVDIEVKYRNDLEYRDTTTGYNKTNLERLPSVSISKVLAPLPYLGVSYNILYDRVKDNGTLYSLPTDTSLSKKTYSQYEYDRIFAEAKIYAPIDLKVLTVTPSINISYTLWNRKDGELKIKEYVHPDFGELKYGKDNKTAYRILGSIDTTIALREIYKKYSGFTHGVENVVELSYIPEVDQDGVPNYLDYDRINEQALVKYKMTNYLKAKNWQVSLILTQGYDGLKEDNSTLPLEASFISSFFRLSNTMDVIYKHSGKMDEGESSLKKFSDTLSLNIIKGITVYGEYAFTPLSKNSAKDVYNSSSRLGIKGKIKFIEFEAYNIWQAHSKDMSFKTMIPLEQFVSLVYTTECWGVGLEAIRKNFNVNTRNGQVKRDETTIYLKFVLTGLGDTEILFYKDNTDRDIK